MPARSTALICTNTSFEPSLGVMNPKPFWVLKNLTVPVAMWSPCIDYTVTKMCADERHPRAATSEFFGMTCLAPKRAGLQGRTENLAALLPYANCVGPSNARLVD